MQATLMVEFTDEMVERGADWIWDLVALPERERDEALRIMRGALVAAFSCVPDERPRKAGS